MFDPRAMGRIMSTLKTHKKVTGKGDLVIVLLSSPEDDLSYAQVTVKSEVTGTEQMFRVVSDSHQTSLRLIVENAGDADVKAYLRSLICDLI
jgi:hypothetical protein